MITMTHTQWGDKRRTVGTRRVRFVHGRLGAAAHGVALAVFARHDGGNVAVERQRHGARFVLFQVLRELFVEQSVDALRFDLFRHFVDGLLVQIDERALQQAVQVGLRVKRLEKQ